MADIVDNGRKAKVELVGLKIVDSSGVDVGDNPAANVMHTKGKENGGGFWAAIKRWAGIKDDVINKDGMDQPRLVDDIMMANDFQEEFCELRFAFMESVYEILECSTADKMPSLITATVEQFATRMKVLTDSMSAGAGTENAKRLAAILSGLQEKARATGDVEKRSAFADAMKDLEDFTLVPGLGLADAGNTTTEEDPMATKKQKMAEAIKSLPKAQQDAILNAMGDDEPTVDTAAAEKAVAELREKFEASEKAAKERTATLEAEVKALREKTIDVEFMEKARAVENLGLETAKVAKHMKRAYASSKEDGDELVELFTAASKQVGFAEKIARQFGAASGRGGYRTPGPGSSADGNAELEKMADELMEKMSKDGTPVTKQQAYALVAKNNPAMASDAINGDEPFGDDTDD